MHFSCRKNKNADEVEQENLKARFERKRQNVKKTFYIDDATDADVMCKSFGYQFPLHVAAKLPLPLCTYTNSPAVCCFLSLQLTDMLVANHLIPPKRRHVCL